MTYDDSLVEAYEKMVYGIGWKYTADPEVFSSGCAELGLEESALICFIRTAYGLLDLISFFTVGEDEVRAWTIRRGTNARKAAGRFFQALQRRPLPSDDLHIGNSVVF